MAVLDVNTAWADILERLSKGHIQATAVVPNWGVCNRLDLTYFFYPESSKSVSFLRKLEFYSSFRLKSSTALYTATNFTMKRPGIIRAFSLNHFYRFEFTIPLRSKSVTGISCFAVCVCCSCLWLWLLPPSSPFFQGSKRFGNRAAGPAPLAKFNQDVYHGMLPTRMPPPRKMKVNTPKMNILNPKSWRFGLDDVPFQLGDF